MVSLQDRVTSRATGNPGLRQGSRKGPALALPLPEASVICRQEPCGMADPTNTGKQSKLIHPMALLVNSSLLRSPVLQRALVAGHQRKSEQSRPGMLPETKNKQPRRLAPRQDSMATGQTALQKGVWKEVLWEGAGSSPLAFHTDREPE